jgi:hypothetical protein
MATDLNIGTMRFPLEPGSEPRGPAIGVLNISCQCLYAELSTKRQGTNRSFDTEAQDRNRGVLFVRSN